LTRIYSYINIRHLKFVHGYNDLVGVAETAVSVFGNSRPSGDGMWFPCPPLVFAQSNVPPEDSARCVSVEEKSCVRDNSSLVPTFKLC